MCQWLSQQESQNNMPRVSKKKAKIIKKVLHQAGLGASEAELILRHTEGKLNAGEDSPANEIQMQLFKRLKDAQEQGVKFNEAELQEFLGQDDIPPQFRQFLAAEES
jgi:hypothetical protein